MKEAKKQEAKMVNQLLNDTEAAEFLNLAEQTLNLTFEGRGPAYFKIGRRVVYRASDLETFLEKHRVEPEKNS